MSDEVNGLSLWTDGTETYVAMSIEQARQLQVECLGENPDGPEAWWQKMNHEPMTIDLSEEGRGKVTQTVAEWIAENGPGFLCSTEW